MLCLTTWDWYSLSYTFVGVLELCATVFIRRTELCDFGCRFLFSFPAGLWHGGHTAQVSVSFSSGASLTCQSFWGLEHTQQISPTDNESNVLYHSLSHSVSKSSSASNVMINDSRICFSYALCIDIALMNATRVSIYSPCGHQYQTHNRY